ncbi:MAG: tetratricopeptide repeat protein [Aureispira sp.]|nr:tetratricopeptide repeat protein [Aureispira sp.]
MLSSLLSAQHMTWEELEKTIAYYQAGDMHLKAIPYFQQILELAELRYTKNSTRYVYWLNELARSYQATKDWSSLLEIYTEIETLTLKIHGKRSVDLAMCWANLGNVYMQLKQYERAEQLCFDVQHFKVFNPVVKRYIAVNVFEEDEAYSLNLEVKKVYIASLNTLVDIYKRTGADIVAKEVTHKALEETNKTIRYILKGFKREPPEQMIEDIKRLMVIYENYENYTEAEELYLDAIQLTQGTVLYLPLSSSLSLIYQRIGEFRASKLICSSALKITKENFGDRSIEFAMAITDLAVFYTAKGDYFEASKLYMKARSIALFLEGKDSVMYQTIDEKLDELYKIGNQK